MEEGPQHEGTRIEEPMGIESVQGYPLPAREGLDPPPIFIRKWYIFAQSGVVFADFNSYKTTGQYSPFWV